MTTHATKQKEVVHGWYVIDAHDKVLGKIAALAAQKLIGKHKVTYVPYLDSGDHVIILNAKDVALTGNKEDQKLYRRHTGYVGNLKEIPLSRMRRERPAKIIEHAISGMLPKNRLRKSMLKRLHIYEDSHHPYESMNPETIHAS